MKHIKLFKSFINLPNSIKEITCDEYVEIMNNRMGEKFNTSEIKIIKSLDYIQIFEYLDVDSMMRNVDKITSCIIAKVHIDGRDIAIPDLPTLKINKIIDEWYVIQLYDRKSYLVSDSFYYLIDQLDGLESMLQLVGDMVNKSPKGIKSYIKSLKSKFFNI